MPTQAFFNLDQSKQDKIIASAFKEFSLNSFDKASILQIAKLTNISRGSIYCYFENKEDIYEHLLKLTFMPFYQTANHDDIFKFAYDLFIYLALFKNTERQEFIIRFLENLNPIKQKFFIKNLKTCDKAPFTTQNFRFKNSEDIHHAIMITLSNMTLVLIKYFYSEKNLNEAKIEYEKILDMLKFGILEKENEK